jgi:hypothetical protein
MRFRYQQIISLFSVHCHKSIRIFFSSESSFTAVGMLSIVGKHPALFTLNFFDSGEVQNVVVEWLTLLLHIWEILGSYLSQETSYPD